MSTLRDETLHHRVTIGPISGSHKVYRNGVPARRISLTNGDHLDVYDTSGPYTDPNATIDLTAGLPPLRTDWTAGRAPIRSAATQLAYAKAGVLTDEMVFAAEREGLDPTFVL
ncbi:MAG TPA: phosphomethylpyrimidine synthase, partial [Pseudonocardiaceae bacterium]|nr:phosphomethylpyrimidine synthase [Pseudonocardiaceae bacterium]